MFDAPVHGEGEQAWLKSHVFAVEESNLPEACDPLNTSTFETQAPLFNVKA